MEFTTLLQALSAGIPPVTDCKMALKMTTIRITEIYIVYNLISTPEYLSCAKEDGVNVPENDDAFWIASGG